MKILIISLLFISTLFADIKVGKSFPSLTLVDQFDTKTKIPEEGSTTLILSFEKGVSSSIKKYLVSKEKDFLTKNSIMYIADISGMPSFISSWIAIPRMKKFSFKISLINDKVEAEHLSKKDGKVTVVTLKDNIVKTLNFVNAKDLDTLLK